MAILNISPLTLITVLICLSPTLSDLSPTKQPLIGSYQRVQFGSTSDLEALPLFSEADKLCRSEYYNRWGTNLWQITEVYSQIVSGVNYKIFYTTECKCNQIYFVVYTQYWTNTVKIVDVANV